MIGNSSAAPGGGALIEAEGVCKSFGGLQALSECSLSVAKGSIAGLIGPNGSGKTTLFNVMTGYERCSAGEIRFDGESIVRATPERVFGLGVGPASQITRLFFRLSVLENMLVATERHEGWLRGVVRGAGSAAERQRALELLEFVGLERLAHSPAGNLSYGQRKLLELASLLVADPSVLLLDEPTAGVNPTLINQLTERIRELNRAGKTFLVVEHNMEFVMGVCHQVTVLHQGRTLVTGWPAKVRANPAVLDAYLGGGDTTTMTSSGNGTDVLLSVDGVTAGYGGGDILKGVSFTVSANEIMCIVGPNGSGKSTLLSTISGILRPRTGGIAFRGESLVGLAPRQIITKGVVLVPQAHSLFPEMTVRENVEMGAFIVRDAALVRRRREEVEEMFPLTRERARDKAGSLSGGQQRLVELARSLMLDPALIVLDEPSIGLDPPTRKIVFQTIRLMNRAGPDDTARRAERARWTEAQHPRPRAGERERSPDRHRP